MRQNLAFLAFNRGLISKLGMARADIKRAAMSAERFKNWMVRVLGSMMLRPGTKLIGNTASNNAARFIAFIFSASDKAKLEFTDLLLRVWVSDALITRPAVTSAVAGGDFPSAASLAANWSDNDEAGGASSWVAAGQVGFTGTGTAAAIRRQTVAVVEAAVEHALRIVVTRGPITIRVGSASLGDDYIAQTVLGTGTHSLAFTPAAGSIYIEFSSRLARIVYLAECTIEAAGVLTLPTPYVEADLGHIRTDQSADVVYMACKTTYQQRKLERRGTGRSWSIVLFQPNDGPFLVANTGIVTMTPSVLSGNGTLTASLPTFNSGHLGALFAATSTGQTVTKSMTVVLDATNSIRVTGVGTNRAVTINITGLTATGNTVVLQQSFDDAIWTDVPTYSYTVDTVAPYNDGLDNQIVYYRLQCTVYAAGTTVATLIIAVGSIRGICRLTTITSNVLASMEVLTSFGGTAATDDWEEGQWSDYRGWPSAVALYEGRLYWPGKDKIVGSISDGFESYDPLVEGDSGVINREIGSGPVDTINFILPMQRLILGGAGAEYSCRSTTFDEPLTPTNFNVKKASRQGSSSMVDAKAIDSRGIYVQRGGIRVFELVFDGAETYDYASDHLSQMVPRIGAPGIVRIGVQRQPDTRVHFVRSDGTVAILIFDKVEGVVCWLEADSPAAGGLIEDVVVIPSDEGEEEDHVYYVVKRTINGAVVRYLERWSTEDEAKGDLALCYLADACITFTGAAATVVTGLSALEGEKVAVWADGEDVGTTDAADGTRTYIYTVSGGQITLAAAASNVVVGLPYTAQWQSAKLVQIQSQLGQQGVSLISMESITGLGIIAANLHPLGLRFGPDFTNMDNMPSVEEGAFVDTDVVVEDYDQDPFTFPGKWTNDARICLQAQSPRPATVLAMVCEVKANG